MEISIPLRGELLAELPLFVRVEPLQRPRLNPHSKNVYQPIKNQQAMFLEMANYTLETINEPVIVDTYENFLNRFKKPADHPIHSCYGDEDNLRKGINDALVRYKILADDCMVVGGENFKAFNTEDVALIRIYRVKKERGMLIIN